MMMLTNPNTSLLTGLKVDRSAANVYAYPNVERRCCWSSGSWLLKTDHRAKEIYKAIQRRYESP